MKKKRWVKYLCLFALTLVLALSAAGTKQAQAATKSGSCGDNATYEYDSSTGTLTISGSGTVEAPSYWDEISGSVKKLVVGDEITDIGTYNGWSSLKTVSIGAKVKSINDQAFTGCSSLTTVDMGDSAVTKIGESAFEGCEKLKTVTFGKKLTKISALAFYYCSNLASISLPSSLKTIGNYAFCYCGFTKVTIPKNVTSIGTAAFCYSTSLTKIAVSSDNKKYSAKNGVLYNKDKTKLITYPAGKTSKSFTVPGTVKTICIGAFGETVNLKTINLNKVEKIGASAFIWCSSLTKITIPKTVTSIGKQAFYRCIGLTKIAVSSGNTKYSAKDGVLYNKAKTKLIVYPEAKTGSKFTVPSTVKTIASYAFFANDNIKSLTIGENVTTIGEWAFGCSNKLKTVVVGAKVKTICANAFGSCIALRTVKFKGSAPAIDTNNGDKEYGGHIFGGVTATIKYSSSEKSSWTKTYRSRLNAGAKDGGGKLTFETY